MLVIMLNCVSPSSQDVLTPRISQCNYLEMRFLKETVKLKGLGVKLKKNLGYPPA